MSNQKRFQLLKLLSGLKCGFGEPATLLNYPRLLKIAEQKSVIYTNSCPFPHVVIDNFLEPSVLKGVLAEFPSVNDLKWISNDAVAENGRLAQSKKFQFPLGSKEVDVEMELSPILRYLLLELNSGTFLYFLRTLTKITGLISDPKMYGGGLHQTLSGGMLRIHADFYKHPIYQLNRRINVLLFLNEHWRPSYGGNLELWSTDMSRCEREIEPIANRCVIFNTTENSYHGYTNPIACPPDTSRKSIAMYYYTAPRAEAAGSDSPTYWQDLPGEK